MTGLTLTVEHQGGTSSTLNILSPDTLGDGDTPSLRTARITRNLIREPEAADEAEVSVYRDAWREVEDKLDRINDTLLVEENGSVIFGGRLRDYQYQETTVSVIIDGPKRDAIDATSSGGSELYTAQNDTAILSSILGRVDTVSAGTTQTVDGAIAFSESYASPGKSITKLAAATDAEVKYRATGSGFEVDYVTRLGTDRTAETLSPSNGNVLGSIRLREKTRQNVNTITVLGAGSGRGQTTASATASSFDPSTDRTVERKHKDKDIVKEDRAAALAQTLVDEYDGSREYLEVECELPRALDPAVGDSFSVELSAYDRSETLRITMLERIIDPAGDLYRAVLSNRRHTRTTDGQQRADSVQSLNEGNAGQIVRDSQSEGYTKVDSGEPQEWFFDFPADVIDEFEAKLRIESRPFRQPSDPQGHSHTFSVPDHDHSVSISDTQTSQSNSDQTQTLSDGSGRAGGTLNTGNRTNVTGTTIGAGGVGAPASVNVDQPISELHVGATIVLEWDSIDAFGNEIEIYLEDGGGDTYSDAFNLYTQGATGGTTQPISYYGIVPRDTQGEDIRLYLENRDGEDITGFDAYTQWFGIGKHNHTVSISDTSTTSDGGGTSSTTGSETSLQPGIVTTTNEVSNVSVDIDGTTVVSGLDAPIQETVDITGELTSGANTITATSDSLGEVRTSITYEALKNASR
jgi:hypothetical protein